MIKAFLAALAATILTLTAAQPGSVDPPAPDIAAPISAPVEIAPPAAPEPTPIGRMWGCLRFEYVWENRIRTCAEFGYVDYVTPAAPPAVGYPLP